MAFSSFSKDYTENAITCVDNRFITNYLPEASGDAVRVYLYGLYLCSRAQEFDAVTAAKLLRLPVSALEEIFSFWEECGLVQILSRSPLYVEYLPVGLAVGKPKPLRPEKYASFNLELFKLLQKTGKDLRPYEHQRILEFLERTPMEQQAFLLVVEYCVKKDGAKLTVNHVFNKAEQLAKDGKFTYEQIDAVFSDYNSREKDLSRIFTLLGIFRKPQEDDYALLAKWCGMLDLKAVFACAASIKKGTLPTLDDLIGEVSRSGAKTEEQTEAYLTERQKRVEIVFKVARKLGVKVDNPRPYAEEYVQKWLEMGYDGESLVLLAGLGLHLGYGFSELDSMIDLLCRGGIVDAASVKAYCTSRDRQLKLLQRIQSVCGVVKKSLATLDMLETWRGWNFSEEMILEAASCAAGAAAPIPYINKLLSEWKRQGCFTPDKIPARPAPRQGQTDRIASEAVIAADERTKREQFYSTRREQAMRRVNRAQAIAEKDAAYAEAEKVLKRGELELAKAELYAPETLPALREKLEAAKKERLSALARLNLSERDFVPRCFCEKCKDTGFLENGTPCDCYKQ